MDTCTITIAGRFQQGKSTLVNCLLGEKFAETGNGLRTTACCTMYKYGEKKEKFLLTGDGKKLPPPEEKKNYHPEDRMVVTLPHPLLKNVTIIDSPGADASKEDDLSAINAIQQSDAVLLLLAESALKEADRTILQECRKNGKKLIVLFNCKNQLKWHPEENKFICETIEAQLINSGFHDVILPIAGKKVFPCNLLWAWNGITGKVDKKTKGLYDELDTPERCLEASGFKEIRNAVDQIYRTVIWHILTHLDQEVDCLITRFENKMNKIIQESRKVVR